MSKYGEAARPLATQQVDYLEDLIVLKDQVRDDCKSMTVAQLWSERNDELKGAAENLSEKQKNAVK